MKATGIVRRIDDLGRICIPRDLRQTLRFKDNDPLEMYIQDDMIILKKYKVLKPEFLGRIYDAIAAVTTGRLAVYDSTYVVKGNLNNTTIVPSDWEYNKKPFKYNGMTVYPIQSGGENVGYVIVENCSPDFVYGVLAMIDLELNG